MDTRWKFENLDILLGHEHHHHHHRVPVRGNLPSLELVPYSPKWNVALRMHPPASILRVFTGWTRDHEALSKQTQKRRNEKRKSTHRHHVVFEIFLYFYIFIVLPILLFIFFLDAFFISQYSYNVEQGSKNASEPPKTATNRVGHKPHRLIPKISCSNICSRMKTQIQVKHWI